MKCPAQFGISNSYSINTCWEVNLWENCKTFHSANSYREIIKVRKWDSVFWSEQRGKIDSMISCHHSFLSETCHLWPKFSYITRYILIPFSLSLPSPVLSSHTQPYKSLAIQQSSGLAGLQQWHRQKFAQSLWKVAAFYCLHIVSIENLWLKVRMGVLSAFALVGAVRELSLLCLLGWRTGRGWATSQW